MADGLVGTSLEDSVVLLTGAAGGIGRTLAAGIAATGARLVISDVDKIGLEKLTSELPSTVIALPKNIGDAHSAEELVADCVAKVGRLDVLVHTAAILRRQPLEEVREEDWDSQHDINLKATFFLARSAAIHMRKVARPGRIILFTSQSFWTGGFGSSVVYAITKGGVATMVRGLARTFGPAQITVNGIAPGVVETEMLRGQAGSANLESVVAQTPLGRIARPDEMVGPVLFLAGPGSSFVTGTILNVSGGWLSY